MAFDTNAGSSGRVQLGLVTPVLTTDLVTYTVVSKPILLSINSWRLNQQEQGEAPKVVTFESSSNAQGVLSPTLIRGGIVAYSFSVEGVFDPSEFPFLLGNPFAVADFITKKATAGTQKGYGSVPGRILRPTLGVQLTASTQAITFEYEVNGPLPSYVTNI